MINNDGWSFLLLLSHVLKIPLPSELITMEDMETVRVDDDILAYNEIPRSIEGISSFILILFDFQELAFIET